MTRGSALRNGLACAALLIATSPCLAQSPAKPAPSEGGQAAGAVIVPPVSDPGMVKQAPPVPGKSIVKPPPMEGEPEAIRTPRKDESGATEPSAPAKNAKPDARKPAPQGRQGAGMPDSGEEKSKTSAAARPAVKDSCKGAAELCRQDSAR